MSIRVLGLPFHKANANLRFDQDRNFDNKGYLIFHNAFWGLLERFR